MSTKQTPSRNMLGIDAGGTFTDFVHWSEQGLRVHKVLSTPDDPSRAIFQGIAELGLTSAARNGDVRIIHGSTVATNAALERKGVKTAYVTNRGFKDILTIGRQARPALYDLNPPVIAPPVPAELCLEVETRRDHRGHLITPLADAEITQLQAQVAKLAPDAVAINLLYAYLNAEEEQRLAAALRAHCYVSCSSEVLPVYKEYERGMATWLNASLGPKVAQYLAQLGANLPAEQIAIMQSSGGTLPIDEAAERAVNLLLSGPAGGLAAMRFLGHLLQRPRMISFDMGGTSTDVALMDGDFTLTNEGRIGDWPVAVPMLDMDTIGAGGGSIAWLDAGGMLHVGPESAGSQPGPACYGLGGTRPTVSDANLILGHLQGEDFLGGTMALNLRLAEDALRPLADAQEMSIPDLAQGIVTIAEQQMAQALHNISVKQGHNPRDFLLCCFGGAGGLHICALADQLKISEALVPVFGGVLSAFGMLCAPQQRFVTRSHFADWSALDHDRLQAALNDLAAPARAALEAIDSEPAVCCDFSLDMRFKGQSYTLTIPYSAHADRDFYEAHKKIYGHSLDTSIEVVNISARLYAQSTTPTLETQVKQDVARPYKRVEMPFEANAVPVYRRADLGSNSRIAGPALVTEQVSTTWIAPAWTARVDEFGNLRLSRAP